MRLESARYDSDLQMYADPPHEIDLDYLRFLRWLSQSGRLEHRPIGPPSGECAEERITQTATGGMPEIRMHGGTQR